MYFKYFLIVLVIDALFLKLGATFGTGITAIKLTALGRPQLLVSFKLY